MLALDIIYFKALILTITSCILWEESRKRPHARQMVRFSVSPHAVAQGQLALSTWKVGKPASTAIPSGVVSGVGVLEVLLG